MDERAEKRFTIGDLEVLPEKGLIRGAAGDQHVEPRAMDVLVYLAARAGTVVSRNELLDEVWKGAIVSDEALSQCISHLRKKLGDRQRTQPFIKTIPKRGYQLTAAVDPPKPPGLNRFALFTATLGLSIAAVIGYVAIDQAPDPVSTESRRTVAVLPFIVVGGDVQDYFGDGLSEELIYQLSKSQAFDVIARGSSFSFRDSASDLKTIGAELGADLVLEGTVRIDEDRFVVGAALIDALTSVPIWSEQFDSDEKQIVGLQNTISLAVVDAMNIKLRDYATERINKRSTENFLAFDLYLQGVFHARQRTEGALKLAQDFLNQALAMDPAFARAYALIAETYILQHVYAGVPLEEVRDLAKAAAMRSLELDPSLAEAHATIGLISMHNGEHEAAQAAYRQAVALDFSFAPAHMWLGRSHYLRGEYRQALIAFQRAQLLDPLGAATNMNVGMTLCLAGRSSDARVYFKQMLKWEPEFANGWWAYAYCDSRGPELASAIRSYHKAISLGINDANLMGQLGRTYIVLGDLESGSKWVQRAQDTNRDAPWSWAALRSMLVAMNDYAAYLEASLARYRSNEASIEYIINAASAQAHAGNYAEVRRLYELADPTSPETRAGMFNQWDVEWGWTDSLVLASAELHGGDREYGLALLDETERFVNDLRQRGMGTPGIPFLLAEIHAMRGEDERAVDALRLAFESGWRAAAWIEQDYRLETIRDRSDVRELMATMYTAIEVEKARLRSTDDLAPENLVN